MADPSIYSYVIFLVLLYKLITAGYWQNIFTDLLAGIKDNYRIALSVLGVDIMVVFFLDTPVTKFLQAHQTPILTKLANFGNALGDGKILYPVLLLLVVIPMILNLEKYKRIFAVSFMSSAYAGILVNILKGLVTRQRPSVAAQPLNFFQFLTAYQQGQLFDHSYMSMPSGHTITVFAAIIPLYLYCKNKYWRFVWLLIASVTAFGRVYSYVHWPSDVLMGAVLGSFIAKIVYDNNYESSLEESSELASDPEVDLARRGS